MGDASRVIQVSRVGVHFGDTELELTALCEHIGKVQKIVFSDKSSRMKVTFIASNDAHFAMSVLDSKYNQSVSDECNNTAMVKEPHRMRRARIIWEPYLRRGIHIRRLHEHAENDSFFFLSNVSSVNNAYKRIPGLSLHEDFITEKEEFELIELLSNHVQYDTLSKRKVAHFGFDFDFISNSVEVIENRCKPIPIALMHLISRLHSQRFLPFIADQVSVTCYESGCGISPHIDTHSAFADTIISLTLASSTIMSFMNIHKQQTHVILARRSLLVMRGQARYCFTHCIRSRKYDKIDEKVIARAQRISITFRKVLARQQCLCTFAHHCDSLSNHELMHNLNHKDGVLRIQQKYVHDFYEIAALQLSFTHIKTWLPVYDFVQALKHPYTIADIGCGSGRQLSSAHSPSFVLCIDSSGAMLSTHTHHCDKHHINAKILADITATIALRTASVDHTLCISVIDHLASHTHRLQ